MRAILKRSVRSGFLTWMAAVVPMGVGADAAATQQLQFRHLGPDEGLSHSWVRAVHQDSRGFLWFGTANGLTRYDGYTFTVYRHQRNNDERLPDSQVNAIHEDRGGRLWVGTRRGLALYHRELDRFHSYLTHEEVDGEARHVNAVLVDRGGTVWVGTRAGLFHLDAETGRVTPFTVAGLESETIHVLLEDDAARIWIGTYASGVFEYDSAAGRVRRFVHDPADASTIPDDDIGGIVVDADGLLWIGTHNGGLASLDRSTGRITRYRHDPEEPTSLARDRILTLMADREGGVWIGTENGGLDYFDPATGRFHHHVAERNDPTGLNSNSVWSILQDASGAIWAGTFSGGVNVSRQNGEAIRHFRSIPGDPTSLGFNSVLGFAEDPSGIVWVATDGGGLNRLDPATGRFETFDTRNSNLASDAVLAVEADRGGNVWVATWGGGLGRFDPVTRRFTFHTPANSELPDWNLFSVLEDSRGRLWIGTWQEGLVELDRASGRFVRHSISPPDGVESQIWRIHELNDGRLALATLENGFAVFDPETSAVRRFLSDPLDDRTLVSNQVHAFLEVEPGILLVGTAEGIDRVDLREDRVERFAAAATLPGATVAGLERGEEGKLWVSTDRGIARLDPAAGVVKPYTVADGLQGSEFNPRSYLRTRDGTLLFGGNGGFNAILPDRVTDNPRPPPVVITDFQLFNRPVEIGGEGSPLSRHISETEHLVLRHDQSVLTFGFAALDFAASEKNEYAYRMEGFDREWNRVGTQRSASYTGLPPGEYVFRVIASNNDGVWNEEGASVRITVTPPFWRTWWFRSAVALVLLGSVYLYLARARYRREVLRRQKEYLENSVGEILAGMEQLSGGDLTVRLPVRNGDEIGRLCRGFNSVVTEIRGMVEQVSEALLVTVAATQQIHASTEEMAAGSQEQIKEALEVATAAEQMSETVADTARHMAAAAEMARRSGQEAKQGGDIARETIGGMNAIASVVDESARAVGALGESSRRIGHITDVIDDIAEQTNLLALNATIEAAHAGEHGRGFAVVAEEVRSLARRTAEATREIGRMIEQIQAETSTAVGAMHQVTGQVRTGKQLVDRAGAALDSIISNSEEVLRSVRQVAAASEEQTVTTTQISRNIDRVSQVNRNASASHEAIARAAENLTQLVEDLQIRVGRFRLGSAPVASGHAATATEGVQPSRETDLVGV